MPICECIAQPQQSLVRCNLKMSLHTIRATALDGKETDIAILNHTLHACWQCLKVALQLLCSASKTPQGRLSLCLCMSSGCALASTFLCLARCANHKNCLHHNTVQGEAMMPEEEQPGVYQDCQPACLTGMEELKTKLYRTGGGETEGGGGERTANLL